MGLSPLLPIAGAAFGSLADKALDKITDGPSFLEVLQGSLGINDSVPTEEKKAAEEAVSINELTEQLEAFIRKVQQKLAATGYDASFPVELKGDGRGGIVLEHPHPDRTAIENLLSDDGELGEEFHRLAQEFAAAREHHGPWASRDAKDFRLRLDKTGAHVDLI
jgi:hypothetical protein